MGKDQEFTTLAMDRAASTCDSGCHGRVLAVALMGEEEDAESSSIPSPLDAGICLKKEHPFPNFGNQFHRHGMDKIELPRAVCGYVQRVRTMCYGTNDRDSSGTNDREKSESNDRVFIERTIPELARGRQKATGRGAAGGGPL